MTVKMCVLGSGSGGNCTAIWSRKQGILIDFGGTLGKEHWKNQLKSIGLSPGHIKGLLITHGHGDHINSDTLEFCSENRIPIYIHPKTFKTINSHKRYKMAIREYRMKTLFKKHPMKIFHIGRYRILPFKVFHDDYFSSGNAGQPLGFCISLRNYTSEIKIGYVTDTQYLTKSALDSLIDCNCLVIETNNDKYIKKVHPNHKNHLSNQLAAQYINHILKNSSQQNDLSVIVCVHISSHNNRPRLVLRNVNNVLNQTCRRDIKVYLAEQDSRTRIIKLH